VPCPAETARAGRGCGAAARCRGGGARVTAVTPSAPRAWRRGRWARAASSLVRDPAPAGPSRRGPRRGQSSCAPGRAPAARSPPFAPSRWAPTRDAALAAPRSHRLTPWADAGLQALASCDAGIPRARPCGARAGCGRSRPLCPLERVRAHSPWVRKPRGSPCGVTTRGEGLRRPWASLRLSPIGPPPGLGVRTGGERGRALHCPRHRLSLQAPGGTGPMRRKDLFLRSFGTRRPPLGRSRGRPIGAGLGKWCLRPRRPSPRHPL
jgi:hypothetical protein